MFNGTEYKAGIYSFDPLTNKSTTLLNNYFGYYWPGLDDLFVDSKGDIWFSSDGKTLFLSFIQFLALTKLQITDYAYFIGITDTPPQFKVGTFRFRPSTGAVTLIDDTMAQPNGVAISPPRAFIPSQPTNLTSPMIPSTTDFTSRKVYISDTGAFGGSIVPPRHIDYNTTGFRTIYSFDLSENGNTIGNRKPIYLSPNYIPDGLKVAGNGWVVTAAGKGVDVTDEEGTLLVRVQTNFTVNNFAWSGKKVAGDEGRGVNYTTLWLTGQGGVSRVNWALEGQELY